MPGTAGSLLKGLQSTPAPTITLKVAKKPLACHLPSAQAAATKASKTAPGKSRKARSGYF